MDYKEFFIEQISGFLNGKYTRSEVAYKVSMEVGIDDIPGDNKDLLKNCEWALRHIDEEGYYTTERELEYYLSCLNNETTFSEKERDAVITN